jgi:transposase
MTAATEAAEARGNRGSALEVLLVFLRLGLTCFGGPLRPTAAADPVIRFETDPGEQMHVDWAVIRRGSNRLSVFVATLGWSRATYVEFVTDERVETLIEAHENAFFAFDGVPREVPYDNMRTVVLERHGYGRGRHCFPTRCESYVCVNAVAATTTSRRSS